MGDRGEKKQRPSCKRTAVLRFGQVKGIRNYKVAQSLTQVRCA